MAVTRFLAALMVSTAGGAFVLVALLRWVATYTHGPRVVRTPWRASRDLYWIGIICALNLSWIAWRAAAATAAEDSVTYLWPLPNIVLIVVVISCVRRIERQRRSPDPQGSSPGGELIGTGGTTIGRGLFSLPTPMWPVLLVAGGMAAGAALMLILGK